MSIKNRADAVRRMAKKKPLHRPLSSHIHGIIDALRANPDDHTLALVLADALGDDNRPVAEALVRNRVAASKGGKIFLAFHATKKNSTAGYGHFSASQFPGLRRGPYSPNGNPPIRSLRFRFSGPNGHGIELAGDGDMDVHSVDQGSPGYDSMPATVAALIQEGHLRTASDPYSVQGV